MFRPTRRTGAFRTLVFAQLSAIAAGALAMAGSAGMMPIGGFAIDRTEVTVGQFRRFVKETRNVTAAERRGGGLVYSSGWEQREGWTWRAPYGTPARDDEPAVHVTFDEAAAFCQWAGKRLPTDPEWVEAAYTERRTSSPAPFETGRTYPFPTGETPEGANCLGQCGSTGALDRRAVLDRGPGHAPAGATRAGVNGLFDMGANVWEWVDEGDGEGRRTRGGSWWYGPEQMKRTHLAAKPRDMAVVYIGFRCARDLD